MFLASMMRKLCTVGVIDIRLDIGSKTTASYFMRDSALS